MDKHNGGPTCKTVYYLIHDCNSVVHHFTITCLLPPPPPPPPQLPGEKYTKTLLIIYNPTRIFAVS